MKNTNSTNKSNWMWLFNELLITGVICIAVVIGFYVGKHNAKKDFALEKQALQKKTDEATAKYLIYQQVCHGQF